MIEVKTQKQLGAALKKTNDGASEEVRCVGDGEFRVVGSSRVYASGSSTVYAYGSSRVYAYGSSRVYASGSSTVYAYGSSTVYAKSTRSEITATEAVAVHIHEKPKKLKGGVHIQAPEPKTLTANEAIKRWMAETNGTGKARTVTLYKAVNDDLKSERGFEYPIGETVEAPDWNPTPACGGGLHISPSPHHATRYFMEATRWLECEVKVSDLALCSSHETMPDKAKAKKLKVVREVTMGGVPV